MASGAWEWVTSWKDFSGIRDSIAAAFELDSWVDSEMGVWRGDTVFEELERLFEFVFVVEICEEVVGFLMLRESRRSAGDCREDSRLCVAFVAAEAKNVEATSLVAEILSLATWVIGFDLKPRGQLPYHFVLMFEGD